MRPRTAVIPQRSKKCNACAHEPMQAVADPTALEMETRKQMAERQAAHDDRNLARALTPAERKDKKAHKLFDDTGGH